jgi:hypothetical protein
MLSTSTNCWQRQVSRVYIYMVLWTNAHVRSALSHSEENMLSSWLWRTLQLVVLISPCWRTSFITTFRLKWNYLSIGQAVQRVLARLVHLTPWYRQMSSRICTTWAFLLAATIISKSMIKADLTLSKTLTKYATAEYPSIFLMNTAAKYLESSSSTRLY